MATRKQATVSGAGWTGSGSDCSDCRILKREDERESKSNRPILCQTHGTENTYANDFK